MIEVFDMPQGSDEWYAARLGLVTASEMGKVLAKGQGKIRQSYMNTLAGERLTGVPAERYSNHHMQRGKDWEDDARGVYAFVYDADPQLVGFVRNGDVGCSPDAFLEPGGVLEIKTKLPALMVDALDRDDIPPEHKAQLQGALWVCEREYADLVCYWPGMSLCVRRVGRDEDYIIRLAGEVARFNDELAALVERVR